MSRIRTEKYGFLLSGVLLLITILYSFAPATENKKQSLTQIDENSPAVLAEEKDTSERESTHSGSTTIIPDPTPEPSQQPLTQSSSETQLHSPTLEEVRKEVAENPHEPPRSILEFASELAPKMRKAYHSEDFASNFFRELRECALNSLNPETIQILCLKNAKFLVQKYPNFEKDWAELGNEIKPEFKKFIQ